MGKVGATGESTMIWTVKEHGDPNITLETEELEDQFLIKWKGWSHLNNTWESQASLDAKKKGNLEVKGIRKLTNYQVKVADYNMWKRRANPEDVEYQEVDIEMGRQLIQTYTEVDRIFSHRKNENNANDYYVKWKNLSYADSTWEDETVVKNYYKEELDLYNARKKAKTNPRNYKDSMKYCKKKRGRPKKVITENLGNRKRMNEEDISAALEESYHEKPKRNRKAVKYDSESEEPDSDVQPEKKRKVQIPEESTGRSGRERKVPKKFEVIIPEKKKRKKKIITSDFSENDDSESDYGSKKRKRKKGKKLEKFNSYKKSPTKVKRKKV